MSALGGIYNLDGAPVPRELLNAMVRSLEARGPDGGSEFSSASLRMVYRAFDTNRESRREQQPFVSDHLRVLAWDGRLDNRDDLFTQLWDLVPGIPESMTDVSLVMAAYEKWGIDFLSNLIGDFALSLWDPTSKTLVLARDPFGTRSLFYHKDASRIIWSSAIDSLLTIATDNVEINENYVAGYLARLPQPYETPYRDFHAVPAGTAAIIRNGQFSERSFWQLDPTSEIRFKKDSEYEEQFLDLFRDSIRKRLRVDKPVGVLLSGGLDSSSVVCVADEIMVNERIQAPRLDTISFVRHRGERAQVKPTVLRHSYIRERKLEHL